MSKHSFINYLAHAYLSFNQPEILVGNMISDFVKGKKKLDYPPQIQSGITLHRLIDDYTDRHIATKAAKEIFRPRYRLYSGAFTDIVYDYFLATDKNEFSPESLYTFSVNTYATLDKYFHLFPDPFSKMFPFMKKHNWLYNYRTTWGIERSFEGLVRRAEYLEESAIAFQLFETNIQLFKDCYRQFWADVKLFARDQLDTLSATN